MNFYMPVKVYEESNCVMAHARELSGMGIKPLIVTGKSSAKKNGSLDDVINALKSCGKNYAHFNKVEENPSIETIMEARDYGIEEGCDYVIGIGGGSPMDAAKAIALMMANPDKDALYLDTKVESFDCLPVAAVPTTCGTGSEVTGVSVLTRHKEKKKGSIPYRIYPQYAFLDAKYLMEAPENIINNTAIDALAHMIESYLNSNATDYSRMFVREGLRYWKECKKVLLGDEKLTLEYARKLMLASNYAGMAIAHTSTSVPHGLSYSLTYDLNIPHGKACAYFLGGYILEVSKEEQEDILAMMGFDSVMELNQFLIKVCGLEEVPKEILMESAMKVGTNEEKLKNCPFKADLDSVKRIAGVK